MVRRFPNERSSVTAVRRFATEALDGRPPELVEVAELLVSELASNCVRHTNSEFEIVVEDRGSTVRVIATDWGDGQPTMRANDPASLSGRGLAIIDMMASAWGVEQPVEAGRGKRVWFSLGQDSAA